MMFRDLSDAVEWAGRAAVPGTEANSRVRAGLRSILDVRGKVRVVNPASPGITPDPTRVLLCEVQAHDGMQRLCVKLYPPCAEGIGAIEKHSGLLTRLKGIVPVPEVVAVLSETEPFGFPALVTTARGQPLDGELRGLSPAERNAIVAEVGRAVARLHDCDPGDLSVNTTYEPGSVLATWQEDRVWYEENAERAGESAGLVRRAASVLAGYREVPQYACVIHRDLHPYNILGENGAFVAIVDWDHAALAPPQEDVATALIGFLAMLSLPRSVRLALARTFLEAYGQARSLAVEELRSQSAPFALDTVLDWVVGGKNAPREELPWATEQIMEWS